MFISLITPFDKLIAEDSTEEIFAPGVEGELNILSEHANFVTELETGVLRWKISGSSQWKKATITYGWLEVYDSRVSVLADVSELEEQIDVKRARQAETIAKRKIEEGGLDQSAASKYELKLKRAMARQSAAGN